MSNLGTIKMQRGNGIVDRWTVRDSEITEVTIDGIRYVKRWVVVFWCTANNSWDRWSMLVSYTEQGEAETALDRERNKYPLHQLRLSTLFVPESLPVPEEKP